VPAFPTALFGGTAEGRFFGRISSSGISSITISNSSHVLPNVLNVTQKSFAPFPVLNTTFLRAPFLI